MSKREFELDLTSVCVGSGVVQLPLKMQSLFMAGDLAATVDGEELLLTFMEPRRLSGFREHFERRGLRSNDKMRFEVEVAGEQGVALVVASIKRERNKPAQQRSSPDQAASGDGINGDAYGAVSEQPLSKQVGSSWGNSDSTGQVRAVRKVRVEGGMPLPVSPATQKFSSSVRSDSPTRPDTRSSTKTATGYGGWTPLDGLSPEGDQQPLSLRDYPEATVREVRRTRAEPNHGRSERQPDLEVAWATAGSHPADPPLYSHGLEVVDQFAIGNQSAAQPEAAPAVAEPVAAYVRPERKTAGAMLEQMAGLPVPPWPGAPPPGTPKQQLVGETAPVRVPQQGFVAAPRIPVPRNTAAGSTWQPTPASGLNHSQPSEVVRQPRLIEETDLNPLHSAPSATARYLEPTRGVTPTPVQERAATEAPAPAPVSAPSAIDDAEFGGEYLPSGRSLEAALLQSANGGTGRDARLATTVRPDQSTALPSPQSSRSAVEIPAELRPEPVKEQHQPSPKIRLEDDLRMVEAYLDRPNTPAIVRSEVIAAELGIDDQRSERALERLSENRDRVSRIRKGAYMVKNSTAAHSSRL